MLWVWAAGIGFTFSEPFLFYYFLVSFHFASALFDPLKTEMETTDDAGSFMAGIISGVRSTD